MADCEDSWCVKRPQTSTQRTVIRGEQHSHWQPQSCFYQSNFEREGTQHNANSPSKPQTEKMWTQDQRHGARAGRPWSLWQVTYFPDLHSKWMESLSGCVYVSFLRPAVKRSLSPLLDGILLGSDLQPNEYLCSSKFLRGRIVSLLFKHTGIYHDQHLL